MTAPLTVSLLTPPPTGSAGELFETLLQRPGVRVERIVSTGQATPAGEWYDQDWDEWVLVLAGEALLRLADENEARRLAPGDAVLLPARCRHRVEWTTPDRPTVWLALHLDATSSGYPSLPAPPR